MVGISHSSPKWELLGAPVISYSCWQLSLTARLYKGVGFIFLLTWVLSSESQHPQFAILQFLFLGHIWVNGCWKRASSMCFVCILFSLLSNDLLFCFILIVKVCRFFFVVVFVFSTKCVLVQCLVCQNHNLCQVTRRWPVLGVHFTNTISRFKYPFI